MEQPRTSLEERWQLMVAQAMGHELTSDEEIELGHLLCHPAFVKAAATAMLNADTQKNQLLKLNLGDEAQRAIASQLQGRISGIEATFGLLLSYAKEKEQSNENS